MADVEKLTEEALSNVTKEDWAKCVRHAENLQVADYDKQCARDVLIEPIVINLGDSSDDSDYDFDVETSDME